MRTIFIIEDDPTNRAELKNLLEKYGYSVLAPDVFDDVAGAALDAAPALVLLDLGLPRQDGHHVCREIRKRSSVPIIVVTSRDTELDELMSIHLGADDFITKPYSPQILLARIENLLKRAYGGGEEPPLAAAGVTLDPYDSTVRFGCRTQELTKNEVRILRLLMKNRGKIISREQIMAELWQSDEFVDDNTLTVNINRLRKKLAEIGVEDFVQTRRGQGYIV